ncbi:MAG: oligosaccharide flippase family protein [Lachnospiraceae bacterium]|nr:oligosaccharide flippase family protein [Lachnospiraceae bacterium]
MTKNNILKPDGAKSNFTFQFLYQAVILVLPLIVSPYLTRTMGSNSLGVYTYTYTIAYYFVTFAMLGINRHGQRIIAQRRDSLQLLRKTFWSLYSVHFIASLMSLFFYFIYVFLICKSNVTIAFVQSIYVFSAAIDVTWLFYGLEKFKLVSIRNAVVKILETLFIFLLVKSPDDVAIYTLIMCISVCVGQLVMMPQIFRAIPPLRFSISDMREHIKPLFTLFAAVIAVTLYTVFDKTLLGILATKDDVAFYEYSDKIVKIPRTFISIIGTVLFPRACKYATDNNIKGLKRNADYCLLVTSLIGFASVFGLAAVGELFAIEYYGDDFAICGKVIIYMSPVIIIIGLGETIRQCFIFPLGKDKAIVRILSLNAVANLILSALLIPVLGIYGAVVGTISAEIVGLTLEIWISRKYISLMKFLKNTVPYGVIGLIMFLCVRLVAHYYDGSLLALLIQVLVGVIIYCALVLLYGLFFDNELKNVIFSVLNGIKGKLRIKR